MGIFSSCATFIILGLARIIPIQIRSFFGASLGRFFSYLPTKDRLIGELQLEACGFNPSIIHSSYSHFGRVLMESLDARGVIDDFENRFLFLEGKELLPELRQKTGAIILTGHYGHWDLLAGLGIKLGIRLIAIGRPARGAFAQKILEKLRNQYGIQTIWRGGAKGLADIESEIRNGGIIAALIDQDTRVRSILVPFLGIPAATPSALITLAIKKEIPIYSSFLRRVSPLRYEVSLRKIVDVSTEIEAIQKFHSHLEEVIRKDPTQWVWFHKRWRTIDDGKRLTTSEYISHLRDILRMSNAKSPNKS